jgi:hypothetical protein
MPITKFGPRLVVTLIALAMGVTPALAQNEGGETPGETLPGGYGYYHACTAGCAPLAGAERPSSRVLRTEGGRYEYVIIGPQAQSEAVLNAVQEVGGSVIRSSALPALAQSTQIATFPSRAAFERAQALLAQTAPDSGLSAHHLYYFAQARTPRVYAPTLIGEVEPGRCRLSRPIMIGMIDGPVNPDHPALQGADLRYETLVPGHRIPDADHGTAVAALMVGQDASGALAGFAQGARLYAISVFGARNEVEEASVERIAEAIDRMAGAGVRLINLSIAGPENQALSRALSAAASRGVVLVAASGNERRPQVAWPAASQDVIAVTAIDAARRRFRMANTGVQVEFAAPGVDVYTARGSGAGYASGTSFAAPIVTALAARQMSRGVTSADAIRGRLRAGVETLGPGTRNTEFGWGLVKAGGC